MQKEVFIKDFLSGCIVRRIHYWLSIFVLLLSIVHELSAQEIGHTTVTFMDTSRGNRQIPTNLLSGYGIRHQYADCSRRFSISGARTWICDDLECVPEYLDRPGS